MSFLNTLKKIPVDLGQASMRTRTKGKLIAQDFVPENADGLTALDVGCREGYQSKFLESRGYATTSIDIEKIYEKCVVMDANKPLPFDDQSFDLIWCSEVIEHLDNPDLFASEARRLLKPEGQLLLTTPNSKFWLYKIFAVFGLSAKELQNPTHKQFFGISDIRKLFPDGSIYGFFPYFLIRIKITKCINILSPTFVVRLRKMAQTPEFSSVQFLRD